MEVYFVDHTVSWEIVPAHRRSTVCSLHHSKNRSDVSAQATECLEWKENSPTGHCNSPNWKLGQVARRLKRDPCLSTHGDLIGFQAGITMNFCCGSGWHVTQGTTHDLLTHQLLPVASLYPSPSPKC